MKIIKYKKVKNGMYQVFFENGNNVDIHEELILKYGLLLNKNVSNGDLEKMLDENKTYIGYDLSVKYLAKKMRTEKEIRNYLSTNFDNSTIEKIITILKNNNYLNEKEYVKAYVNDRILLSNDGPNKIRNKLIELGISEGIIIKGLEGFDKDTEKEKINSIIQKIIKTNKNKSSIALKNKTLTYLYNLGYSKDSIMNEIEKISFKNDESLAKKEYDKIYKRLSRKYNGDELNYKVKQKMYALGFRDYN